MKTIYLSLSIVLMVLIACKRENISVESTPLLGQWGGRGIQVVASDTQVTFEFDCAAGVINRKVMINDNNQFSEKGTFTVVGGNRPITAEMPKPQNVQYEAKVSGNDISLDVKSEDGKTIIGSYTLSKDVYGKLFRCM